MNTESQIFLIIVWFYGLVVGWCFKKSFFLGFLCLVFTASLIDVLILMDYWMTTGVFILGLLTHTGMPLYRKLKSL